MTQQESPIGPMTVLFCADPGYFRHVATSAVSLATHNKAHRLRIHVLSCESDPSEQGKLITSLRSFENVALTFHCISPDRIGSLFVDRHLTKETYLRLLAPDILPEQDRILYLDSDIIVMDDLGALWATNLAGYAAAGASDVLLQAFGARKPVSGVPYIGAGVLLMNLSVWRREGIARQMLDYIAENGERLAYHDQDALNVILSGKLLPVDYRWNLQASACHLNRSALGDQYERVRQACRQPAIVHYTGSRKPWMLRYRSRWKGAYYRSLAKTAWRDDSPRLPTFGQRIEHAVDRRLSRVGVDYMQILHVAAQLGQRATAWVRPSPRPAEDSPHAVSQMRAKEE